MGSTPPITFTPSPPPLPQHQAHQKMKTPSHHNKKGKKHGKPVEKKCLICHRTFTVQASHINRRVACSTACRNRRKVVIDRRKHLKKMSEFMKKATEVTLTPVQSAKIRYQISRYITEQLPLAHSVVTGATLWNPTQARVFSTLLNKVVPDLSAAFVQHEVINRPLVELSRSELEAIASSASTTAALEPLDPTIIPITEASIGEEE